MNPALVDALTASTRASATTTSRSATENVSVNNANVVGLNTNVNNPITNYENRYLIPPVIAFKDNPNDQNIRHFIDDVETIYHTYVTDDRASESDTDI